MVFDVQTVLYVFIAYLVGAVPFGLLLTRMAGLGDIRAIGSGNIGATNVLRTGNKLLAALTLLLDGGKGALAFYIGTLISADTLLPVLMGVAAVVGHIFSLWLKCKGGKGVATALGFFLAASLPLGLFLLGMWAVTAVLFRFSSLAALVAFASAPLFAWGLGMPHLIIPAVFLAILITYKHQANIQRLLKGTEPAIGARVQTQLEK